MTPVTSNRQQQHELEEDEMKILDSVLGVHEKALQVRSQRMELLAANIANADTPKFKARDVDFKQVMGAVQLEPIKTTHGTHFDTAQDFGSPDGIKFRVPFNAGFDGNTVEMNVEQAQYGKAAADYRATLMFLESKGSGIKRALRGE
jgi:flagellar basal-body rod protein FlgB